jgi:hypothetical protein
MARSAWHLSRREAWPLAVIEKDRERGQTIAFPETFSPGNVLFPYYCGLGSELFSAGRGINFAFTSLIHPSSSIRSIIGLHREFPGYFSAHSFDANGMPPGKNGRFGELNEDKLLSVKGIVREIARSGISFKSRNANNSGRNDTVAGRKTSDLLPSQQAGKELKVSRLGHVDVEPRFHGPVAVFGFVVSGQGNQQGILMESSPEPLGHFITRK